MGQSVVGVGSDLRGDDSDSEDEMNEPDIQGDFNEYVFWHPPDTEWERPFSGTHANIAFLSPDYHCEEWKRDRSAKYLERYINQSLATRRALKWVVANQPETTWGAIAADILERNPE